MALIYLVEDDAYVRELYTDALQRFGLRVHPFDRAESALQAFRGEWPDLLITDLSMTGLNGRGLIERIRSTERGRTLPIILISGHFGQGVPRDWSPDLRVERLIPKPCPLPQLIGAVRELLTQRRPVARRPKKVKPPDRETVLLLSRAWRRRLSGVFSYRDRGIARIYRGDPVSADDREVLRRAIPVGNLRFARQALPAPDQAFEIGSLLYPAALHFAEPDLILELLDHTLVELDGASRVQDLPLEEPLRSLLAAPRGPRTPLGRLLERLEVEPGEVAPGLSALVLLGIFRLSAPSSAGRRAARSAAPGGESALNDVLLLKRLRRELRTLPAADDWTVLGVPRDAEPAMIRAAAQRQRQRYESMARAPRAAPQVKSAAQQIVTRIDQAAGNLLGVPEVEPEPDSREESFFERGRRAMDARQYDDAARWFERARARTPGSARNLAYLGWATFNRRSLSDEQRMEQASDLLSLAATMDPTAPDPQHLIAAFEVANGRPDRARARLARLLKRHPDHAEARALMNKVMAQLRARST